MGQNREAPNFTGFVWSEWQDLNLRPPRPERGVRKVGWRPGQDQRVLRKHIAIAIRDDAMGATPVLEVSHFSITNRYRALALSVAACIVL